MKSISFAALLLTAVTARADPPTAALRSIRLHLSTDTIHDDRHYVEDSTRGFASRKLIRSSATIALPGLTFDAYVGELSTDKIDFEKPDALSKLTKDYWGRIAVFPAGDLVKVDQPEALLVSTRMPPFFSINLALIKSFERTNGEFEGFSVYGQPFYLPKAQVEFLKSGPPIYKCGARYSEIPDIRWVSYNKDIGEAELAPICNRDWEHRPDDETIRRLLTHEGVFAVGIPSD